MSAADRHQMNLDTARRYFPKEIFEQPATHQRGNPAQALAGAATKVLQTCRTRTEHHNPMETHATGVRVRDLPITPDKLLTTSVR